ncbi:MAG: FISUMP domain-containing protein [Paludibacter sp.]|nr:FISUMP domain-containing protein [Paludibacter sp.]
MKRLLLIITLFLSLIGGCKSQDYIAWQAVSFTPVKYGLLYNWFATQDRYTANVEYGYLYNRYAVADSKNIAAAGWHVPSKTEMESLITEIGGGSNGGKLKETGLTHWRTPNTGADNSSGFNGRGSGTRNPYDGTFSVINDQSLIFSSTLNISQPWALYLQYSTGDVSITNLANQRAGGAVRLICDSSTDPGIYVGNDNRIYQTVKIGSQVWLSENLMETKYRDGTAIPEVTNNTTWAGLTTGARCSYSNTESNAGSTTNVGGISSSSDWVVPTYNEIYSLVNYLGGVSVAGGKLKETGYTHWESPNIDASNEVGFNARGSGMRDDLMFFALNNDFNIWSSTTYQQWYFDQYSEELDPVNTTQAMGVLLATYNLNEVVDGNNEMFYGLSVRLLYVGEGTPSSYIGNDGKIYPVVQIGSQWWLDQNLQETKFKDGAWIPGYDGGVYTPISNANWAAKSTGAVCVYGDDETNK